MLRPTLFISALCCLPLTASAAVEIVHADVDGQSGDDLAVDVSAIGQAGAEAQLSPRKPSTTATSVDALRAQVKAKAWRTRYRLQLEAKNGQVEVLDLDGKVKLPWNLSVHAGRFKVPVSQDFMVPLGDKRFIQRASLTRLMPRRALGASADWKPHVGGLELGVHSGVFLEDRAHPEPFGALLAPVGERHVMGVGALDLHYHHFEVHAAAGLGTSPDPLKGVATNGLDDAMLDAGLRFDTGLVHLDAEAAVRLDDPAHHLDLERVGVGAMVSGELVLLHIGEVEIDAAAGYNVVAHHVELEQDVIMGVTVHATDHALMRLNTDARFSPRGVTVFPAAQVQLSL